MDESKKRKLQYFRELMECIPGLEFWEFSGDFTLADPERDDPRGLYAVFCANECLDFLKAYATGTENGPLVLSDITGLSWIAVTDPDEGSDSRVFSLGPVLSYPVSRMKVLDDLRTHDFSDEQVRTLCAEIEALPILSISAWTNIGTMLCFTVSGSRPGLFDFRYQRKAPSVKETKELRHMPQNSTWIAEQAAMKAIEDGNLDYKDALTSLSEHDIYSLDDTDNSRKKIQKLRTAVGSLISLCTRAAIRGGLAPETAYYVGELYMDQLESSSTSSELSQVTYAMYDEFVKRVHEVKVQALSPVIQTCCTYIQQHIQEQISMEDLAKQTGYVEYYLTRKFSKEMGISVTTYIKNQRIDLAKQMLLSTERPVQDIAFELGFCNTSYFTRVFRETTGKSPSEFRAGGNCS